MNDSFSSFGPSHRPGDNIPTEDELMGRVSLTICCTTFWHLDRPGVASVLETGVYLEGMTAFLWYTQLSPYTGEKHMLLCKDPARPQPILLTRLPNFICMTRAELIAATLLLVRERADPFRLFSERRDTDYRRNHDEVKWFEMERLSRRWESLVPEVETALSLPT